MHLYLLHIKPDLVLKRPWRQATFPVVARDPATPAFDANHFAGSQTRSVHFSTKTQLSICCLYQLNFSCAPCPSLSLCFLLTKRLLSFFLSLTAGLQALPPDLRPPPVTRSPRPRLLPFDHIHLFTFLSFTLSFTFSLIRIRSIYQLRTVQSRWRFPSFCVCRCKSVILDTHYPGVVIPLQDPMWKRRRDRIRNLIPLPAFTVSSPECLTLVSPSNLSPPDYKLRSHLPR